MDKFGVAVRVRCSTKSSTSAQDRSLKNESFAVRSDCCRSDGCTWWVLYNFGVWNVDLSHRKFGVLLKVLLNNATLKHIKRPQNNCRVFSLPLAASMTGFLSVNRTVNLENACNSFRLCFFLLKHIIFSWIGGRNPVRKSCRSRLVLIASKQSLCYRWTMIYAILDLFRIITQSYRFFMFFLCSIEDIWL